MMRCRFVSIAGRTGSRQNAEPDKIRELVLQTILPVAILMGCGVVLG
jgi:hypothetical protein